MTQLINRLQQQKAAPSQLCTACELLNHQKMFHTFQEFPRLRLFFERVQDDLLTTAYHHCTQCDQIWREDMCDYPADRGHFWILSSLETFLGLEGERLPTEVVRTPPGVSRWLASFAGYYAVEIFREGYCDRNGWRFD